MPVSLNLPSHEYPQETDQLPDEFQDFLKLGKDTLEITAYGWKICFTTLPVWEKRDIARRHANLDFVTRDRLADVDFLTEAIVEMSKGDKKWTFTTIEDKTKLRTFLLKSDKKPLEELYDAYLYLERRASEKFLKEYGRIKDKLSEDFFGLPGLSSEPSASKTQETQTSKTS